jgi:hypothetical protein
MRKRYIRGELLTRPLDDPASTITHRRHPVTDLASDQSFSLARQWLNVCERNHRGCPANDFIPALPTYVVDVLPAMSTVAAKLYKTTEGERDKYLCLSYCWGTRPQYTTTEANLTENICGLPISRLGLTIQDAIETTRRLGFRYLWCDALCIVYVTLHHKICSGLLQACVHIKAIRVIRPQQSRYC